MASCARASVLLALSFPKFGHPAFGWIALAPLLLALSSATLRRAFALGLLTGVIYFTGTLYWITGVMAMYGDLPHVGRRCSSTPRSSRTSRCFPRLRARRAPLVIAHGRAR